MGTSNTATVVAGGLKVTGGTPAVGKVLTSDASGMASWVDPAGGVNADWNAISGSAVILNKPTIPTNTIELINGSGYISSETDPVWSAEKSSYYTKAGTDAGFAQISHTHADATTTVSGFLSGPDKAKLNALPVGANPGEMNYWNGTAWVGVAPGTTGQNLTFCNGVPTWGPCPSFALNVTKAGTGNGTVTSSPSGINCGIDCSEPYTSGTVVTLTAAPTVPQVTNPITGKIWMDRNLGASQVATSSTDAAAYGDLYQWGRATDGHQIRTSGTTETLSSTDTPGHSNFITAPNSPYDWRSPQNVNLWQGVNGVNNPCPTGFRIPTSTEFEAERLSWSSNDAIGAFTSPLKLPMAGFRLEGGSIIVVDGRYWSGTVDGSMYVYRLYFSSSNSYVQGDVRSRGHSVRCIKD
jgi:hypothetical protein